METQIFAAHKGHSCLLMRKMWKITLIHSQSVKLISRTIC